MGITLRNLRQNSDKTFTILFIMNLSSARFYLSQRIVEYPASATMRHGCPVYIGFHAVSGFQLGHNSDKYFVALVGKTDNVKKCIL